jgi:hypothetical protein
MATLVSTLGSYPYIKVTIPQETRQTHRLVRVELDSIWLIYCYRSVSLLNVLSLYCMQKHSRPVFLFLSLFFSPKKRVRSVPTRQRLFDVYNTVNTPFNQEPMLRSGTAFHSSRPLISDVL